MEQTNTEVTSTQDVSVPSMPEVDPVDRAAYEFSQLIPQIKGYAKNMGGKGLARVVSAFIEFPLADSYPKFKDKTETELFMMLLHAQGAKSIMTDSVLKDANTVKEIEAKAIDSVVEEELAKKETKETTDVMAETGNTTQG